MSASDEPRRSASDLELRVALGPLGHRINQPLGTARLAVDLARHFAASSDRAQALDGPLADVARCIDEAGHVTKALQRMAYVRTEAALDHAGTHPDWNRLVSQAADRLGAAQRLSLQPSPAALPVAVEPEPWVGLLAALFQFALARSESVQARTVSAPPNGRLIVTPSDSTWLGDEGQRLLDPFSSAAPVDRLEELTLFVVRGVALRHGGRFELVAQGPEPVLALELPLAE